MWALTLKKEELLSKINVFVDGSWLFKVCKAGSALAKGTASPTYPFPFDFSGFVSALVDHVKAETGNDQVSSGKLVLCTSIFDLPDDFNDWPTKIPEVLPDKVELTKRVVHAKETFSQKAKDAGFSDEAEFHVKMKPWIMSALDNDSYQEKQVDTTLVALLVKSAFDSPDDYHAVVSGDADMLPALRVAYPDYTKNVLVVTTHPDELDSDHKHSSYSYLDYKCDIDPFYFQLNLERVMEGNHKYRCHECGKLFTTINQIPGSSLPRCRAHRS
ncbi:hypothetical protein CK498_15935 [Halomonas salipaludis]|uniref:NYN domain-containing protein n=1 Tax=Halomonas salipaludis TaxID=2032625 RepID=A0A2A2ESH1_9GAMM|nr:hypothetical protein CK498_15935 [Halomonas salipaludis]